MANRQNHQNSDLPKLAAPAQRALTSAGIRQLDDVPSSVKVKSNDYTASVPARSKCYIVR